MFVKIIMPLIEGIMGALMITFYYLLPNFRPVHFFCWILLLLPGKIPARLSLQNHMILHGHSFSQFHIFKSLCDPIHFSYWCIMLIIKMFINQSFHLPYKLLFWNIFLFASTAAEMNKRVKQVRDQVVADSHFNPLAVFELLLNVGQFEFKLKEVRLLPFVWCFHASYGVETTICNLDQFFWGTFLLHRNFIVLLTVKCSKMVTIN